MELLTSIGTLLKSNNEDPSEFLTLLSNYQLTVSEETCFNSFLPKLFFLFEKQVLRRDLVYLSLLAKQNLNILNLIIEYEKSNFILDVDDPVSLYNYCIYWNRHWIYDIIENFENHKRFLYDDNIYNKLLIVKLVEITHLKTIDITQIYALLSQIKMQKLPEFWQFYIKQIGRLIEIVQFIINSEGHIDEDQLFRFANQNNLLMTLSVYMNLDNVTWHDIILDKIKEFEEKYNEKNQFNIFTGFVIMSTIINLIIKKSGDYQLKKIQINKTMSNLKDKFLEINDQKLQIELLEDIFSILFYRCKDDFICGEKEVRLLLFLLKDIVDVFKFRKNFDKNSEEYTRFQSLSVMLSDAMWRLELITNVKISSKQEVQYVHYMLAPPLSLIHLCLKRGDFDRASQVIDIFDMRNDDINFELCYAVKLLKFHNFLSKNCPKDKYTDNLIETNLNLHLKIDERTPTKVFADLFDFGITTAKTRDCSNYLIELAKDKIKQCDESYLEFTNSILTILEEVGDKYNLSPAQILTCPNYPLDIGLYRRKQQFYKTLANLFDQFYGEFEIQEDGTLNKNHNSHKTIVKINEICNQYVKSSGQEPIQYLIKVYNYLQAFSRILYIEENSSDIISRGRNTSYFELLHYNRSELTGKLLFERCLDPTEFERYFSKLKLDFLYHVVGNCFPTINLHVHENVSIEELYHDNMLYIPSKNIIVYIQKRNWLLAFILNQLYNVEGVKIDISRNRLQTFFNYLKLPRVQNLKQLFDNNEIVAALQNCISAQKVKIYLTERTVKEDLASINSVSSGSSESLETGKEIFEDIKTTNWKELYDLVGSIPENQLKKKIEFVKSRNTILANLVQDSVETNYYRYTHLITNRDLRIDTILRNFKKWPGQFALDIIQAELTKFDFVDDVKLEHLHNWKLKIELCDKLRPVLELKSWYKCHEFCKHNTSFSFKRLLTAADINLLLKFIELYKPSEDILCDIELNYIVKIIELNPPFSQIKELFDLLPFDFTINVCNNLLTILRNLNYLQFIADYLNTNVSDDIFLKNVQISLKILSAFTALEQDQLFCLISEPLNILEVLIMNTKLDKFARVLEILDINNPNYDNLIISVDKVDRLLRVYAEKSLDFRVITQPKRLTKSPEFKLLQSMDSLNLNSEKKLFMMPDNVPSKDEWIHNEEVLDCMCCQQIIFSMFNRRHHCRRCGRIVCYNCSLKRMLVPTYGDILVRVCNDCYEQTIGHSCSSEKSDTPSIRSFIQEYWLLNDDPEHNKIVREEFSYEHAPSVSLCLSILKYHSKSIDCPKFLLEQCEIMLHLLLPTQEPTHEIDYLLVIKMLKSLTIAAKMLCAEHNLTSGTSTADRILSHAELLGLLAERGCLNLMPVLGSHHSYVDASVLRRLREKLLQLEQWDLALEVSTKAGLHNNGIFAAWGKSCLKAGCLGLAREKFQRCFEKTSIFDNIPNLNRISELSSTRSRISSRLSNISSSSESKPNKDPPLLNEIVRILEAETQIIYSNVPKEYQDIKLSGSMSSLNQLPYLTIRTDPAISILNRLKRIRDISSGKYCCSRPRNFESRKPTLDPIIFNECIYYLERYGSNLSLLDFYIKHGEMETALQYLLDNRLNSDLFVEIYMKCLRDGIINLFQEHMIAIDSSLEIWVDYLKHICRHLEKQQLFNCLYQLQLFMSDYVRASMTCLRFYQENARNFCELASNVVHLTRAEEHLKQILEQDQWVEVSSIGNASNQSSEGFEEKVLTNSSLVMKIEAKDVHKHIATINKQIQLVQFFTEQEKIGVNVVAILKDLLATSDTKPSRNIPTLFGTNFEKICLSTTAIVADNSIVNGFKLASDLIQEFKLRPIKVYCLAGKQLAKFEQYNGITLLINSIKSTGVNDSAISDMLDEVLTLAIGTLIKANITGTKVEDLIKLIKDRVLKISAYIEAKQLKTAYFLAVKYKRTADVRRIQREAELLNMPQIKSLCQKYLMNSSQTGSSSSKE